MRTKEREMEGLEKDVMCMVAPSIYLCMRES